MRRGLWIQAEKVVKHTQAASSVDAAYATEVVRKLTTLSAANLKVSTEKVGDKEVVALEVDGAAFRDDEDWSDSLPTFRLGNACESADEDDAGADGSKGSCRAKSKSNVVKLKPAGAKLKARTPVNAKLKGDSPNTSPGKPRIVASVLGGEKCLRLTKFV